MKNKAIFLDRDGTIVDTGYTQKIEDAEIIPGVIEGLKLLQDSGYKRIIITNQSGIGRGYFTQEDYFEFRNEIFKRLNKKGITISREYFCPHHPDDDCNCRKPKTGMLEQAAGDFGLDLSECWMIGDNKTDILAGKNAGCKTIHVLTGYDKFVEEATHTAIDLLDAANYILSQNK